MIRINASISVNDKGEFSIANEECTFVDNVKDVFESFINGLKKSIISSMNYLFSDIKFNCICYVTITIDERVINRIDIVPTVYIKTLGDFNIDGLDSYTFKSLDEVKEFAHKYTPSYTTTNTEYKNSIIEENVSENNGESILFK